MARSLAFLLVNYILSAQGSFPAKQKVEAERADGRRVKATDLYKGDWERRADASTHVNRSWHVSLASGFSSASILRMYIVLAFARHSGCAAGDRKTCASCRWERERERGESLAIFSSRFQPSLVIIQLRLRPCVISGNVMHTS